MDSREIQRNISQLTSIIYCLQESGTIDLKGLRDLQEEVESLRILIADQEQRGKSTKSLLEDSEKVQNKLVEKQFSVAVEAAKAAFHELSDRNREEGQRGQVEGYPSVHDVITLMWMKLYELEKNDTTSQVTRSSAIIQGADDIETAIPSEDETPKKVRPPEAPEELSKTDNENFAVKTVFAAALTNKEIGAAYRDARKASGNTQVEVAEAMNIAQNVISKFERGAFSASPDWKAKYLSAIGYRQKLLLEPEIAPNNE